MMNKLTLLLLSNLAFSEVVADQNYLLSLFSSVVTHDENGNTHGSVFTDNNAATGNILKFQDFADEEDSLVYVSEEEDVAEVPVPKARRSLKKKGGGDKFIIAPSPFAPAGNFVVVKAPKGFKRRTRALKKKGGGDKFIIAPSPFAPAGNVVVVKAPKGFKRRTRALKKKGGGDKFIIAPSPFAPAGNVVVVKAPKGFKRRTRALKKKGGGDKFIIAPSPFAPAGNVVVVKAPKGFKRRTRQ